MYDDVEDEDETGPPFHDDRLRPDVPGAAPGAVPGGLPSVGGLPADHARVADALVDYLTTRQHLRPHAPVIQVLEGSTFDLGCCPQAVQRAVAWLGIAPTLAVGRLRRTELVQLARSIVRFWAQSAPALPRV